MVPAHSHKVSRVSWYSGSCSASFRFAYGALTLSGRSFQNRSATVRSHKCSPNPGVHALRFGLFPFRSPLLWRSHVVFFSSGYLDVSVHRVPDAWLCIHHTTTEVCSARFPHSEICGSLNICFLPQLIAAYHVFHRLSVPRHPPCALLRLTFICIALHTRALIRYFVLSTDLSVFCLLFITKTDCQLFGYLGCLNFYFYQ